MLCRRRLPVAFSLLAALAGLGLVVESGTPLQARGPGPFVLTYFLGNGESGLHLAYSRDGLKFSPLADGQPVLVPAIGGKLMRDTCVVLGPDNVFHAVWTTGWWEPGIGLAHSKDLLTWTEAEFLPVMLHERGAANAWAPEILYDDETQQYIIYWATTIPGRFPATDQSGDQNPNGVELNHRIYRTTTRDFKDYSRAELFYDPGFNVIDATIVKHGKRFVMFMKDETKRPEAKKHIRMAFADHAIGPYTAVEGPLPGDNWVEGPTAFRVGNELFVLFDAYTRDRFEGLKTRDLKRWQPITEKLAVPEGARHGTVLAVPDKVLTGLLARKPK
jgi:hypothetical protein